MTGPQRSSYLSGFLMSPTQYNISTEGRADTGVKIDKNDKALGRNSGGNPQVDFFLTDIM